MKETQSLQDITEVQQHLKGKDIPGKKQKKRGYDATTARYPCFTSFQLASVIWLQELETQGSNDANQDKDLMKSCQNECCQSTVQFWWINIFQ